MILKVLRTMKGNMWNLIRKQIHTAYTLAVVGAWTASDFLCFFLMCGRNKWTSIDRGYCKRPRARDRIPAWKPCPWATHGQYLDVHPTYSVGDKQSTTKLLLLLSLLLYIYYIYWHILSVFCFLNLLSVMQPQHIAMHMWPWFPSDLRGAFQWTCGLHWIAHDCITWILPGVVEWLVSGIYPLIYIYMDVVECIPKYILSLFFGNTDYQTISGCI